jgi:hypothetical protein
VHDRRNQSRLALRVPARRARHWVAGAWHDLNAQVVDVSSRGVGLRLDRQVRVGDRLSLVLPLGEAELRVTVEIRHARADAKQAAWHVGGLFKSLAPADHERVLEYISRGSEAGQRL